MDELKDDPKPKVPWLKVDVIVTVAESLAFRQRDFAKGFLAGKRRTITVTEAWKQHLKDHPS